MPERKPLHLFEGVGIELEYMIVDRDRLDVLPICDQVMAAEAGEITDEIEFPDITWNNELVLHVLEFKTSQPAPTLAGLGEAFARHRARAQALLDPLGGTLMPTAMHPWMDPYTETRTWPHESSEIYDTFNRIFDCRGHGWSNLQSLHINLPFADDEEFGRLHAAIRLLLPIMPALSAASPIMEGKTTGLLDNRLAAYRVNCARIPSITGQVIPEPVFHMDEYRDKILQRIYRDLAPYDPAGTLHHEWVNARGAIARFSRNSIEIRVLDVQECPTADLAIASAVVSVLKLLCGETWCDRAAQQSWATEPLAALLDAAIRDGERAVITDSAYLELFGLGGGTSFHMGRLWEYLIDQSIKYDDSRCAEYDHTLETIIRHGPLSRRILQALPGTPSHAHRHNVYTQLAHCLTGNRPFNPS